MLKVRYKNALEDSLRLTGKTLGQNLEAYFGKLGLNESTMNEVRAEVGGFTGRVFD